MVLVPKFSALRRGTQFLEVVEEAFRSQTVSGACNDKRMPFRQLHSGKKFKFIVLLTNDDLPVLVGVGHLVSGSHLRVAGATYHEDDDARHVAHVLLCLVLVPLTVTATASISKTNNQ